MEIITLSAFVVALVQVVKMATGLNTRYAPLVALLLSFILIYAFSITENVPLTWVGIQNGLIAGLSAVGLWSGVSTTFRK